MPSSSSCASFRLLPVSLQPLEANTSSLSPSPPPPPPPPPPPRGRRPRRVLYPAYQSRRLQQREAPDQAVRWLLLLSAVVLLQIYSEETNTCTELQSQTPDSAASLPQESEGNLGTVQGWRGEEPWRVQTVGGASESQMECVVA